jgi:hypothetical protein
MAAGVTSASFLPAAERGSTPRIRRGVAGRLKIDTMQDQTLPFPPAISSLIKIIIADPVVGGVAAKRARHGHVPRTDPIERKFNQRKFKWPMEEAVPSTRPFTRTAKFKRCRGKPRIVIGIVIPSSFTAL